MRKYLVTCNDGDNFKKIQIELGGQTQHKFNKGKLIRERIHVAIVGYHGKVGNWRRLMSLQEINCDKSFLGDDRRIEVNNGFGE